MFHHRGVGGFVLHRAGGSKRRLPRLGTPRRKIDVPVQSSLVGVLGRGMPIAPAQGIRGGHLSPADPILSEWNIAVIGPHFASCLAARDLGDSGPDLQRRFEFVLSHNRELAIKAATALFTRIAREPVGLFTAPC